MTLRRGRRWAWCGLFVAMGLGTCAGTTGCNGHRVIQGDSQGEDVADDGDARLPVPDLPAAELPPGCENGLLEPGDVCLVPEGLEWAGIDPCDISVGDFDRDGVPDAAVPNSDFLREDAPDHVANILYGTGEGLGVAQAHPAGGPLPVSVVTLDFDGDGWPDLAVGNSSEGTVTRLRNRGTSGSGEGASFDEEVIPLFTDFVGTVAAGDLDGDGRDELLVPLTVDPPQLTVVRPDGGISAYGTQHAIVALAADDVDGDGLDDIVVTTTEGDLQTLDCEGNACAPRASTATDAYTFGEVLLEDMDGDGRLDAVYTGTQADGGVLGIARGDGNGGFSAWTTVPRPYDFGLRGLVIEDFDRDGLPDVVLTESDADRIYALRGIDFGEFEEVASYETGATPISAASADFDGDGLPDVAVALQHANLVQVLMSRP